MGPRASTARGEGFTDVLPTAQRVKLASKPSSATSTAEAPALGASTRPVEAAIPAINAPPHALLRSSTGPTTSGDERFAVPESVRKSNSLAQFERACSEILPGFVYVSNLQVAQDREALRHHGITHVVNCCKEVVCFDSEGDGGVSYLQLAVRDGVQEDLLPFFPLVIQFIDASRRDREDARVLIHCHQGVSRSCAFAIAFVMYRDRCGFQRAITLVKTQRAICAPNAAFLCQLLEWERALEATVPTDVDAADYGLYRLVPHAEYDPATLVLKPCYHDNSRRKVAFDGDISKLWRQGIFVFVDAATRAIVVWKGPQCAIPNGVEIARQHVRRMLCVLAGETAAREMVVSVVEGEEATTESGTAGLFEYASEVAWMRMAPTAVTDPVPPDLSAAEKIEEAPDAKPNLFLLEADGRWERLTNYDSDDLLAASALLLIAPQRSYLWIGQDRPEASSGEALRTKALECVKENRAATAELKIEYQDSESEAFWDAFEAGY